jgi:hypothetical protein
MGEIDKNQESAKMIDQCCATQAPMSLPQPPAPLAQTGILVRVGWGESFISIEQAVALRNQLNQVLGG